MVRVDLDGSLAGQVKHDPKRIPYSMLVSKNGCWRVMEPMRRITVEVPPELPETAQRTSGTGITQTVRAGLELVAASQLYTRLRQFRGKIPFARTLAELKTDR